MISRDCHIFFAAGSHDESPSAFLLSPERQNLVDWGVLRELRHEMAPRMNRALSVERSDSTCLKAACEASSSNCQSVFHFADNQSVVRSRSCVRLESEELMDPISLGLKMLPSLAIRAKFPLVLVRSCKKYVEILAVSAPRTSFAHAPLWLRS